MKERVLKVLLDRGTLIEPEASDYILSQKDPVGFIKDFVNSRDALPLILTLEDVRSTESVLSYQDVKEMTPQAEVPGTRQASQEQLGDDRPPAPAQHGDREDFHVIMDITGHSTCDGNIDNFTNYFRDRFRILRRIVKSHVDIGSPIKIKRAAGLDREVKVIGMVSDVSRTKNGHQAVTIEDDSGELFVLISKDNEELIDEVILKDEVLGFVGKVVGGSPRPGQKKSPMFIPSSIRRPQVPMNRSQRRSKEDVEVVFMSDIHVGSSHFLQDAWDGFIDWTQTQAARKVRYIVVAGDMVDGIGIYPNQEEELTIPDIMKQYEELARIMAPIPERMKIIMQPGNHDAVRPAEPQPAISERLQKYFPDNYIFVGNPCYFSICGVEILSYHGRSIDDLVGSIPEVRYDDPILPMLEMLKRRHLAVTYGAKTPLAPEVKDYMVINPVPDIFVTGHVHRTAVDRHRVPGTTLINASAWQSQTPFQKMHNFHPDPGKVVVTNLKTGRCKILDFIVKKPGA